MSGHRQHDTQTRPSLLSRMREPRDGAAWREFEERYGEMILGWCRRCGLRQWDAEDVRQRVMIDLCRVLGAGFRYRPELGRFRHYLGRAVGNAIRQRARRVEPAGAEAAEPASSEGEQDARWEQEWRDHHLRIALRHLRATLGPRPRDVLERLLRGERAADIAAATGTNEAAVRKTKQRLLAQLRERVRNQVVDEDGFED